MKKSRERCLSLIITIATMAIMTSSLLSGCHGFNVTHVLNRHHKRFSTLNDLLTKTNLAAQINLRRPITLLAFDNAAAAESPIITSSSANNLAAILAAHVILDYYDVEKLTSVAFSGGKTTLTTLFEETGAADPYLGLLNVSLVGEGEIAFGSAAPGGDMSSKLVETVVSEPYKISVLQITAPIMVPGIITPPEDKAYAPRPEAMGPTKPLPPPPVGGREEEDIYLSEPPYIGEGGARRGSASKALSVMVLLVASCLVAKW